MQTLQRHLREDVRMQQIFDLLVVNLQELDAHAALPLLLPCLNLEEQLPAIHVEPDTVRDLNLQKQLPVNNFKTLHSTAEQRRGQRDMAQHDIGLISLYFQI